MTRTTDEWAELLDGTTPGPWRVGSKDADGNTYVGNYDPDIGGPAASTGSDDAPLVAAAPDAVAEVIRLRRALEAQRDRFRSHAKADSYLAKVSTVPLVPFYGDQARLLDRILNGDTDD